MKLVVALVIAVSSLEMAIGVVNDMTRYLYSKQYLKQKFGCGDDNVLFTDYYGTHSTTVSGKTCIPWKDATRKKYRPSVYPKLQENYCRNPSGNLRGPWCYVGNSKGADEFEFCDIPNCPKYKDLIGKQGCPMDENGNYNPSQLYNYTGPMDMTKDGLKCVNWNLIPYNSAGSNFRYNPKNYARAVGEKCGKSGFLGLGTTCKPYTVPHCYALAANNKRIWKEFLNPCV